MLFFTDRGKVYAEYVFRIAEGGRTDKGTPAINIINLEADEKITEMVCVHEFSPAKYLLMGTANGKVKRTPLSDFANIRSSGIIAMGMEEGDELLWAKITGGNDDVVIVSRNGRGLRFGEKKIRAIGRTGSGVRAMKLAEGDRVASMAVCRPEEKMPQDGRNAGRSQAIMALKKVIDQVVGSKIAEGQFDEVDFTP